MIQVVGIKTFKNFQKTNSEKNTEMPFIGKIIGLKRKQERKDIKKVKTTKSDKNIVKVKMKN